MYYSLLYPDYETYTKEVKGANRPAISEETAGELGLAGMFALKGTELSSYFTYDKRVIEYRLAAFRDMLAYPELGEILLSVFPILNDIIELRRLDTDNDGTTYSYLYSISEVELYISCIDKLRGGFSALDGKLESTAFILLSNRIKELCESDYYRELNQRLSELTARVRDIKSVTIGVNLDSQLRPSDAGVLSINSRAFHSGDVIDKILRLNFKDDEYTCIASLVPFARGQTEDTKVALSYAFNSAVNQVFRSSIQSWKKAVQYYVLENTDFLLSMMPEIELMVRAAEVQKKLLDMGCPLSVPQIADDDKFAFTAKGLYNPAVALQIEESIIKNDITFDDNGRIFVLTGPNRGGKSVITCAVGIAQAMAQLGMYAPADNITISPVDGIYTHFPVGADDTIDKGRLGEECVRLAVIFDKVTERSLVLLDESLSSTGAYEAAFIAAEVLSGFAQVGCRTIFSTHLHELAAAVDDINLKGAAAGAAKIDNLVAKISDGKRSFEIHRAKPDGRSYAKDIAEKYGLSYEQIQGRINKQ